MLTRTRLQRNPPDILFTTTEILNQRLSDHWMRGLFGVGLPAARKPLLALLDEVHTYEGGTGAQAALTLRRWRHLLAAPISWVGLSATLGDAAQFFSDLTGADLDDVVEDLADARRVRGARRRIDLLRGDPASRASLLSTTIQTSMLLPNSSIRLGRATRQAPLAGAPSCSPTTSMSPIASMTICATRRLSRFSADPMRRGCPLRIFAGPDPMPRCAMSKDSDGGSVRISAIHSIAASW